ncbi:MAG: hypothetical protein ABWY12_11630 [Burkholderiales bacterium]
MQVEVEEGIKQAFVVEDHHVAKIWKTLEENGMEVRAKAYCSDGLVRRFTRSKELLHYENPQRAAIRTLEIDGYCYDGPMKTAGICLRQAYVFGEFVSLSLGGEEAPVTGIRTSLRDTLDGMKPWYSWIATAGITTILMVISIVGWGGVFLLLLAYSTQLGARAPAAPFGGIYPKLGRYPTFCNNSRDNNGSSVGGSAAS